MWQQQQHTSVGSNCKQQQTRKLAMAVEESTLDSCVIRNTTNHVLGKMEHEVMSNHELRPRVADYLHPDVCTQSDTSADKAPAAHMTDKEPITSSQNTKLSYHNILVGSAKVKL